MKKHILITGGKGQLGREIHQLSQHYPSYIFFFTDIDTLNITHLDSLDSFFLKNKIDLVINCAAYTAVDKAEEEQNKAFGINALAVENIGKISNKYKAILIHISTDYVFDGCNYIPYKEEDETMPATIYGKSKLAGEYILQKMNANSIIIRTSWLYSSFGHNFVKTILKHSKEKDFLNVIFDQIGTPTYAKDLARTCLQIADKILHQDNDKLGIYHYSNEGVTSWYDFAQEIVNSASIECSIIPVETHCFPIKTTRPNYSVLNKGKIKKTFDLTIPHWRLSLKKCLKELEQNDL